MHFFKDDELLNTLDTKVLNEMVGHFVSDIDVTKFHIFESAWENIVAATTSHEKQYVVRISTMSDQSTYSHLAEQMLLRELNFVEQLHVQGLSVPTFLPALDGEPFCSLKKDDRTHYVALMEFIEGTPAELDLRSVVAIAQMQARLHEVTKDQIPSWTSPLLDGEYSVFGHRVTALMNHQTETDSSPLYGELSTLHGPIVQSLADEYAFGPKQMIHADVTLANVLMRRDGSLASVIDFNDCRYGSKCEDIGVFFWSVCDSCPDIAAFLSTYAQAYRDVLSLSEHELSTSIMYAIDRYLTINRHYLVQHQGVPAALKSQEIQAERELIAVKELRSFL